MDDYASSTAPSAAFVSAEQSPVDTGSPLIFRTPSPGRESDASPYNLYASLTSETLARQGSPSTGPTAIDWHNDEDRMPPVTRRQERLAAQAASSSPVDVSTSLQRLRSQSPITRENILEDASPHSASYAAKLEAAVDQVLEALYIKGRIQEGNAVQELFNQSFKDAGSRVLLDALLRNRADDRQNRDFKHYVRDVAGLGQGSPPVAGPKRSPESSVLGKRRRRESMVAEQAESNGTADESSDGGIKIPAAEKDIENFRELETADAPEERDHGQKSAATSSSKKTRESQPSEASHQGEHHMVSKRRKKTRRGRKGNGTARKLANLAKQDGFEAPDSSEPLLRRPDAARLEVGTNLASGSPGKKARQKYAATGALETVSTSARGTAAVKKEKRMFKGANGPVYLTDILGLPN